MCFRVQLEKGVVMSDHDIDRWTWALAVLAVLLVIVLALMQAGGP